VVRVDGNTGRAHFVVSANVFGVGARVDDHADGRLGNRSDRLEGFLGHRLGAAVDEHHAVFAPMHRDVAASTEDHPHVVANLNGIERALIARTCGRALLCIERARPRVGGADEHQRHRPLQRVFRTKSRYVHGRRSVHHFYFGGIFAALLTISRGGDMRHRLRRIPDSGLLIVLLSLATASAQSVSTAQINGTVRDQSGGGLPGVDVTVTQTDTRLTRTAETDETCSYILQNLPSGPYRFDAELQGFRKFVQTGIVLQVNANPTLNVTLQLGQVAETITVEGTAALVETRNPGIGQVITNQQVVELPLNGRQLTELVFQAGLATGGKATADAPGGNALNTGVRSYPNTTIVVAGGLSNGMTYLLDGGTHNDPFNNLNPPLPFPDAMQEFKVETNALPAQYGHHSAAAVHAITKSGTNAFHGDAFEFLRDHRLNATNAFAALGPDGKRRDDGLRRDQFGGTLGGPVGPGKDFFFRGDSGTRRKATR